MADYSVQVTTGDLQDAGTWDHIYVTIIGEEGQSDRTELDDWGRDFKAGHTRTYTVKSASSLGKLLLVKVEKDRYVFSSEDEWFCATIVVTTPEGEAILFPCYRWISREEYVELRGGRAMKGCEETHPLLIEHRKNELKIKKSLYQWAIAEEGIPKKISIDDPSKLPAEIRVHASKMEDYMGIKARLGRELKVKGLLGSTETWESFEAMTNVFRDTETKMSQYTREHWKEDDFYGTQFLNGANPTMIKRCTELPRNFPVTQEMVKPFLAQDTTLWVEMRKGNIFIVDEKKFDGITSKDNGEQSRVASGFCLFYMNPDKKLKPIAIQLQQEPSELNPIFLPSDSETDWLLAKIFIRNVETIDHQSTHHLLSTHLMAEVYAMATLRCFAVIHPLYKLLIPHFRETIGLNTIARTTILGPNGVLTKSTIGYDGVIELMRRSLPEMTFTSLCLPENIAARGLQSVPNFYYRDDGIKVWNIINGYVKSVVEHYYPTDCEVCEDVELQDWIKEIFTHGFLGSKDSGIPSSFHYTEVLIRFLTMVIFTSTAQHSAVNNGQYDYGSSLPNGPMEVRKPLPTTKGQSSLKTILETLPNIGMTVQNLIGLWLLTKDYENFVPLGASPERFEEPAVKQMIKEFQGELASLSEEIVARNSQLEVPYSYLDPKQIENSTAI